MRARKVQMTYGLSELEDNVEKVGTCKDTMDGCGERHGKRCGSLFELLKLAHGTLRAGHEVKVVGGGLRVKSQWGNRRPGLKWPKLARLSCSVVPRCIWLGAFTPHNLHYR